MNQSPMLPKHEIVDPKTKLLNVCCASLVGRPQYYSSTDDTRGKLVAAADAVCEQDPEFLLKTALYVRDDLNIRSTANFLLALAASKPEARSYLRKYFAKAVRLPTDLTEVVELYQSLVASAHANLLAEGSNTEAGWILLAHHRQVPEQGWQEAQGTGKGCRAWSFWSTRLQARVCPSWGHAAGPQPGGRVPEDEACERQLEAAGEVNPH